MMGNNSVSKEINLMTFKRKSSPKRYQKPIPANNFKKYSTKHKPNKSILKPKIRVKEESEWVIFRFYQLENHHQTNYSYNIYMILQLARHDDIK